MESSEGVKALHVAPGTADACDPDAVADEVLGVDFVYYLFANRFLGGTDAPRSLDSGDGRNETRAGNPEARRHLATALVLYHTGTAGGTLGSDAEGRRFATELACYSLVVVQRSSSPSSGTMYTLSPGFIMP